MILRILGAGKQKISLFCDYLGGFPTSLINLKVLNYAATLLSIKILEIHRTVVLFETAFDGLD